MVCFEVYPRKILLGLEKVLVFTTTFEKKEVFEICEKKFVY
jgi:hypothetical protein